MRPGLCWRAQVAFALRDLLTKAPIREAAKHQRGYPHLSSVASGFIEPAECLNRLSKLTADNFGRFQAKQIEYQVSDLLLDALEATKVNLDDQLELEVAPSGVRAVRLDELVA